MFPPKKKPQSPFGGGPPSQAGIPGNQPPDPFGGGAPGGDPFGPAPAPGPAMPPGMDPFGAAAPPPIGTGPGMPRPGQGMDPMQAMLQGLGPDPSMTSGAPPAQGPPLGPDGFPVGGSMPPMGDDGGENMGGSGLLQALAGSLGGGQGDPYTQPPGAPDQMFQGIGQGDPNMGLQQMLQMFALGKMGVGGGPGAGSSGVDVGPFGNMGQMVGY